MLQVLKKLKLTILVSVLMAFMEERTLKVVPLLFLLMSVLHFFVLIFCSFIVVVQSLSLEQLFVTPMGCSMTVSPLLQHLPEFTQTNVH